MNRNRASMSVAAIRDSGAAVNVFDVAYLVTVEHRYSERASFLAEKSADPTRLAIGANAVRGHEKAAVDVVFLEDVVRTRYTAARNDLQGVAAIVKND